MSLPTPVRKWFVLYGRETMTARAGRYAVVLWVWATLVATMLLTRRTHSPDRIPLTRHARVAIFTAQLRTISRMDMLHENTMINGHISGMGLRKWTPPPASYPMDNDAPFAMLTRAM
eukprot:SAG31_NODE_2954_length_4863_cov_34.043451_2_plen_117_part_00